MQKEVNGHISKKSLVIMLLPSSKPYTVKGKWTYKVKHANLDPLFKSRLTAKGFMQIEGLHYNETFASTAQHEVIRIFLVLVAYFKLHLSQLDFELAFLNSELHEEIWVDIDDPVADLRRLFKIPPGYGLRIMKCIYGLKQASRESGSYSLIHSYSTMPSTYTKPKMVSVSTSRLQILGDQLSY